MGHPEKSTFTLSTLVLLLLVLEYFILSNQVTAWLLHITEFLFTAAFLLLFISSNSSRTWFGAHVYAFCADVSFSMPAAGSLFVGSEILICKRTSHFRRGKHTSDSCKWNASRASQGPLSARWPPSRTETRAPSARSCRPCSTAWSWRRWRPSSTSSSAAWTWRAPRSRRRSSTRTRRSAATCSSPAPCWPKSEWDRTPGDRCGPWDVGRRFTWDSRSILTLYI